MNFSGGCFCKVQAGPGMAQGSSETIRMELRDRDMLAEAKKSLGKLWD